jgi:hypothetical protein
VIDLGIALPEQSRRTPGPRRLEAQHRDPIQYFQRTLLPPEGNDGHDVHASTNQFATNDPGGAAIASVLAPGEDFHADETDAHKRVGLGW